MKPSCKGGGCRHRHRHRKRIGDTPSISPPPAQSAPSAPRRYRRVRNEQSYDGAQSTNRHPSIIYGPIAAADIHINPCTTRERRRRFLQRQRKTVPLPTIKIMFSQWIVLCAFSINTAKFSHQQQQAIIAATGLGISSATSAPPSVPQKNGASGAPAVRRRGFADLDRHIQHHKVAPFLPQQARLTSSSPRPE